MGGRQMSLTHVRALSCMLCFELHVNNVTDCNKWCFINKFWEEHAQIFNTANSSSVITPPIQSARERTPINNQSSLTSIISRLPASPHLQPVSTPAWGRSVGGEHSGSGLNAVLGPLSPGGVRTPGSGMITELGTLSLDRAPNMHNNLFSLLYVSVNLWKANLWVYWVQESVLCYFVLLCALKALAHKTNLLADWLSMLSKRWAAGEKKHSDWLFSLIDQCMKRIVIQV